MTTDQAFTDYYREHFSSIVRLVRPITPDAAEDVAQDAFALLYQRWDLVSGYDLPWAWVALVAKRLAVRRAGREARRAAIEHPSWSDGDPSPDPDVWAALATLPSRQATALVLHHLMDRPMSEVADRLGCTESAVRVLAHRGRRRIAEPLSGYTGRWISEATWTVDAIAAHLRASGAAAHVDVVVDGHLFGRGGRWEFVLDRGSYLLQREDGLRLDDGAFVMQRSAVVLSPSLASGHITLGGTLDGDRLSTRLLANTTPPTDGVPDSVWMRLFLTASPFRWTGPPAGAG